MIFFPDFVKYPAKGSAPLGGLQTVFHSNIESLSQSWKTLGLYDPTQSIKKLRPSKEKLFAQGLLTSQCQTRMQQKLPNSHCNISFTLIPHKGFIVNKYSVALIIVLMKNSLYGAKDVSEGVENSAMVGQRSPIGLFPKLSLMIYIPISPLP